MYQHSSMVDIKAIDINPNPKPPQEKEAFSLTKWS